MDPHQSHPTRNNTPGIRTRATRGRGVTLQLNDSNKPVAGVLTEIYVLVPWYFVKVVLNGFGFGLLWNVDVQNSSENRERTKTKRFVPTAFTSVQVSWSEHEQSVLLVPASAIIHESTPSLCSNSYFTQLFTGAPSKNPQQLANSCNPNKCLNNAQCIEGKSTFFCVCPPNTSGRLCEKKTTPTTGTTIVVDLWYG